MEINEDIIRQNSEGRSFERGMEYYLAGAVLRLERRGDMLFAEIEGSDIEPYEVAVVFDPDGPVDAECTCPYDWGGWCKHIVAALLRLLHEPNEVEERPEVSMMLAPLDRESLRDLLLRLARRMPRLADEIEVELGYREHDDDAAE